GVGISQRSRKCSPPPQTPTFSHSPPNWAGYLPSGIRDPVMSPVYPFFSQHQPGQHQRYHSPPVSPNHNPGIPLYRNNPTGGRGPPVHGQGDPPPPFYQREFSAPNQVSVYRPSAIRPGQYGYGRVPFSLPLHRQNRQARHTENGTDLPSFRYSSRPSSPSVSNRQRFNWHSVTAPPPPISPLSRPNSPAISSPFATSLHRPSPVHRDREPHPGFSPQVPPAGSIYPLRHPRIPHLGVDLGGGRGAGPEAGAPQVFKCSGPEKEYRRCFSQVCPGAADSRAEQCAAFNNQEFMGRLYNWEPFTEVGADKQCELTCRPASYRFYVQQAERVRDGTPCFNVSANDVCVEGRCLTEGCDGILDSGTVTDRCGVCGGRESSCRRVTGSFQNVTVPLGYHKILDIPAGATFINITERRASPNYLAMRSGTGASVVNGRWAVDPPGQYQAGGTTFTYARPRAKVDADGEKGETLTAPGPTTTQLQLYVSPIIVSVEDPLPAPPPVSVPSLSSSSSSSSMFPPPSPDRWTPDRVRPQGSAPNRNARIPPRTDLPLDTLPPFVWRRGGLTECSVSCGKGSQSRVILCVNRHTNEEVPDRKCDSAARPVAEEEPCNTEPCPPLSAKYPCLTQRQLQCRQTFGNRSTMVHPQRCAFLTPPESTQPCQLRLCSHWEVSSDWSTCSVDCGVGRRTRSVRCVTDQGSVVNDVECSSRLRPQGSEECNMGPCVTNWYFTGWSNTCSAQCGPGVQRREVVCLTRGGVREGAGGGDCVGDKPAEMKACNGGPCVSTVTWYSSPWTQCNVLCGSGSQRRDIICVQKTENDFTVVPAAECAHLDKPAAVQECHMGCSRSCGKGLQMREVRCLTPDRGHSQECDLDTKPEQEQICNIVPCSPQVPDKNCRDKHHNCVMVVQARLCVYSYYKSVCCASCTQSAQRAKRQ
uniref:PLAC domain-containing protein n=1 Tax=Cynoglossus semilaevis TaxID=244447 RepID=A0A3P8UUM0_CYNSE